MRCPPAPLCNQTSLPIPWRDLSRLRATCSKAPAGTASPFVKANRSRRAGSPLKQVTKSPRQVSSHLVSAPRQPSPATEFRPQRAQPRVDRHRVMLPRLVVWLQGVLLDLFQDSGRLLVRSTDRVQAHTRRDWSESNHCVAVAATPAYSKPQKLSCR